MLTFWKKTTLKESINIDIFQINFFFHFLLRNSPKYRQKHCIYLVWMYEWIRIFFKAVELNGCSFRQMKGKHWMKDWSSIMIRSQGLNGWTLMWLLCPSSQSLLLLCLSMFPLKSHDTHAACNYEKADFSLKPILILLSFWFWFLIHSFRQPLTKQTFFCSFP